MTPTHHTPVTIRRAVQLIVSVTFLVVFVSGLVVWLFDRQDFTSLGLAWWWSLQTATTVGYGDIVPRSAVGRAVGAALMVLSTAFLTTITAGITSLFVDSLRRRREDRNGSRAELRDVLDRLDRIEAALQRTDDH